MADVALFLASDAARFVTGAVPPVEGGYLLPVSRSARVRLPTRCAAAKC